MMINTLYLILALCISANAFAETTTFYVARHGQTESNAEGRIQGQTNTQLSEKGRQEAKLLGTELKNIPFSIAYASDLDRARDTAAIVVEGRNIQLITDKRIRERFYGPWEGKLRQDRDQASLEAQKQNVETDEEMRKRTFSFLDDVATTHPGKTILIVSHAGVMRGLLSQVMKIEEASTKFNIGNTAYFILQNQDGSWSVSDLHGISILENAGALKGD